MTKEKTFDEWLAECPVDFDFQTQFESQQANCTDDLYTFRGIPRYDAEATDEMDFNCKASPCHY